MLLYLLLLTIVWRKGQLSLSMQVLMYEQLLMHHWAISATSGDYFLNLPKNWENLAGSSGRRTLFFQLRFKYWGKAGYVRWAFFVSFNNCRLQFALEWTTSNCKTQMLQYIMWTRTYFGVARQMWKNLWFICWPCQMYKIVVIVGLHVLLTLCKHIVKAGQILGR